MRCLYALALAATIAPTAVAQKGGMKVDQIDPKAYAELKYRFIGPDGNRVIAVVGVPGEPRVYYAGAASGGVFKSSDGGTHWDAVSDSMPAASIGSLAVAPSDHNIVWAGTGETFIRSNISIGDGVYKSTDAGRTWKAMGLPASGRVGRLVIDPRDANVVFAAALGHAYGPQPERGVFRTRDGGKSWERVLFVNDSTGAIDIAMDPTNPDVLYAGMWQVLLHPWGTQSGGKGSGVYKSTDGGTTWKRLDEGLPKGAMGKIAVGVSRTNPDRVYTLIETADPGLYRSDDGGKKWKLVNQDHDFLERPHYYTRFAVAPDDENRLYFVSVRFSWSLDGGVTKAPDPPKAGGDLHDIWIDPTDPDRMMVGDDGGVGISVNRGKTWLRVALPNAQMYHVHTDNRIPYYVYGNRQDGFSYRGPSNSLEGERSIGMWQAVGGCESGFAIPDTVDGTTVWSGCYDAGLERYDIKTRMARAVEVWPEAGYGVPPKEMKYRFQWTFPIHISPHDHNTVYTGSQYVHRTTNGGQSWEVISPDLTTNDSTKQQNSGGLVTDNLFVQNMTVLFAIAESPRERGLIWAGSMDGLVHVTRDNGAHWTNVTAGIPKIPRFAAISNIEPSRWDAGTAYISVDAHQMDDRSPYIYKTTDYGKSWRSIGGGIPKSVFSYVHVVREDPVRRGMLYAGTENGVWFTLDDGATWLPLQNNLPHAPAVWLTVQEHFDDLVVATYGRGFWIFDDISAIRQLDPQLLARRAALLPIRPAYRFRKLQNTASAPNSLVGGDDPPYGAGITYYVKPMSKEDSLAQTRADADRVERERKRAETTRVPNTPANPAADTALVLADVADTTVLSDSALAAARDSAAKDSVPFTVLDAQGKVVRRFKGPPVKPGMNRAWWDLRHDSPRAAKLRTPPPAHAHARVGSSGSRPLITWDLDIVGGQVGPLVAPGTYTVQVRLKDSTYAQPVLVRRDPNSAGSDEDIALQLAEGLSLREDMNAVVDMIDQIEWLRKQLGDLTFQVNERKKDLRDRHEADTVPAFASADSIVRSAKALEKKALAVESKLFESNLTGAREDAFRAPNQLYEKLASLASDVGASSADFRPTDQQLAVHALLRQQLGELRSRFEALERQDIANFNRGMEGKAVRAIMFDLP
jgi:photosystem II stability/assembly factor-like uncharacterized protein